MRGAGESFDLRRDRQRPVRGTLFEAAIGKEIRGRFETGMPHQDGFCADVDGFVVWRRPLRDDGRRCGAGENG